MRFADLPMEYKLKAVDFLRRIKKQEDHVYCFSKTSQRRRGAYSSWEQHRNCDVEIWAQEGRCKHGTYVGGCGADYMCGYCENGMTDYEWAIGVALDEYYWEMKKKAKIETDAIFEFFKTVDYNKDIPTHKAMIERAVELNNTYR